MKTIANPLEIQELSDKLRREGKKIGLVPTMGFLHDGHISLVRESKKYCDITFVSIFVNPTQFAPNEDFNRYPRDIERDSELLGQNDVDYLFLPDAADIYKENSQTYVEVSDISRRLEGKFRPTHFKGVTTVVTILFNIIKPHSAFFGQKDAQQTAVIKQMVKDLHQNIEIVVCPIIREKDGLAMSSRNIFLSPADRTEALSLYNSLKCGSELILKGETNPAVIIKIMEDIITSSGYIKPDYIKIVHCDSFIEPEKIYTGNSFYLLVAAKVGKTRLIDNLIVSL